MIKFVYLTAPLEVYIFSHNGTYESGTEILLTCHANTQDHVTVSWSRDGQTVVRGERALVQGFGQLLLSAAHGVDSGNYTCTATREDEVATASTKVLITGN